MKRFCKNSEAVYLHAEIAAIAKAVSSQQSLEGATLYVVRSLQDKSKANSKPCKGCEEAIRYFKIKSVVYTSEKGVESNVYC